MTIRPKLLDLFCGAGGAAMGYHRAGFDVTGVDIHPQKNYPFPFILGDALDYLSIHGRDYDIIHASPPCQRFSVMTATEERKQRHPDLIERLRYVLNLMDATYVIENVPGAPLIKPIILCGTMFELKVYRHRLFESTTPLTSPTHPSHEHRMPRAGYGAGPTGFISVAGHFKDVDKARTAMGIEWMTRNELAQAIPPAYTEFIGRQILDFLA